MYRDIEFRGQRIDYDEMVFGSLIYTDSGEPLIVSGWNFGLEFNRLAHSVKPETIGQYIGLKDKNSVKIFERDIITLCVARNNEIIRKEKYLIAFEEGCFTMRMFDPSGITIGLWGKRGLMSNSYPFHQEHLHLKGLMKECPDAKFYYKIIGKLHEHPELLGKESA
jgi:uncharacterized phage protein (TIGR01671 family)